MSGAGGGGGGSGGNEVCPTETDTFSPCSSSFLAAHGTDVVLALAAPRIPQVFFITTVSCAFPMDTAASCAAMVSITRYRAQSGGRRVGAGAIAFVPTSTPAAASSACSQQTMQREKCREQRVCEAAKVGPLPLHPSSSSCAYLLNTPRSAGVRSGWVVLSGVGS